MNILAIETGSTICQIGLQCDGERIFRQLAIRSHSQVVLSLIDKLLLEAGIVKQSLGAIVVNHGPGSFTGIRVGVSVAQGLGFVLDIPVYGVSSLQTLALSAYLDDPSAMGPKWLFATIDARMSQIYCAWYRCDLSSDEKNCRDRSQSKQSKRLIDLTLLAREQVVSPHQLSLIEIPEKSIDLAIVGSGQMYRDEFPAEYRALPQTYILKDLQPSADLNLSALLDIAEQKVAEIVSESDMPKLVEPVYLRNKVTG